MTLLKSAVIEADFERHAELGQGDWCFSTINDRPLADGAVLVPGNWWTNGNEYPASRLYQDSRITGYKDCWLLLPDTEEERAFIESKLDGLARIVNCGSEDAYFFNYESEARACMQ